MGDIDTECDSRHAGLGGNRLPTDFGALVFAAGSLKCVIEHRGRVARRKDAAGKLAHILVGHFVPQEPVNISASTATTGIGDTANVADPYNVDDTDTSTRNYWHGLKQQMAELQQALEAGRAFVLPTNRS